MSGSPVDALRRRKIAVLTTYRRDGTAVPTPVSIVVDNEVAYLRTFGHTAKVKRLRRNSNVLAAPATFRGRVVGPPVHCVARLLHGTESRRAARRISWHSPVLEGVLVPLVARLRGYALVHYELTAVARDGPHGDHEASPPAEPTGTAQR